MLNPHIQRRLFLFLFSVFILGKINAQDKITFIAPDKLLVTGDLYFVNDTLPYMILCHDIKSSRGEYKEIAHRFNKLGFNCIALDMRVGGTKNGVVNETVDMAQAKHMTTKPLDSQIDITGAINYAYERSSKKIALLGSGYSASLVLYIGATNPRVSSVYAFSPADYFNGALALKAVLPKYTIPVFVTSSTAEATAAKAYVLGIPTAKLTFFTPPGAGAHGTDGLLSTVDAHHDYWLTLLMYIHQLQGGGN